MKVRFFYNPILIHNEDGTYTLDIFMDKRGKVIPLGVIDRGEYHKVLLRARHICDCLTNVYGGKLFYGKRTMNEIREVVSTYGLIYE